jgi:hypothetical protein
MTYTEETFIQFALELIVKACDDPHYQILDTVATYSNDTPMPQQALLLIAGTALNEAAEAYRTTNTTHTAQDRLSKYRFINEIDQIEEDMNKEGEAE